MRPGGILPQSIPQPAHPLWQAPASIALPKDSLLLSHRTALLCQTSRQDAHRDPHPGHAPLRQYIPVAGSGWNGRCRRPGDLHGGRRLHGRRHRGLPAPEHVTYASAAPCSAGRSLNSTLVFDAPPSPAPRGAAHPAPCPALKSRTDWDGRHDDDNALDDGGVDHDARDAVVVDVVARGALYLKNGEVLLNCLRSSIWRRQKKR